MNIILVFDDMMFCTNDQELWNPPNILRQEQFKVKLLKNLNNFVAWETTITANGAFVETGKYVQKILKHENLKHTPVVATSLPLPSGPTVFPEGDRLL